jgi:hypothetical protein
MAKFSSKRVVAKKLSPYSGFFSFSVPWIVSEKRRAIVGTRVRVRRGAEGIQSGGGNKGREMGCGIGAIHVYIGRRGHGGNVVVVVWFIFS